MTLNSHRLTLIGKPGPLCLETREVRWADMLNIATQPRCEPLSHDATGQPFAGA